MRTSPLVVLGFISSTYSHRLAQRVDQSINPRAEYVGGWAWSTSDQCTGTWSSQCDTSNNSCCPTGETCFDTGYGAYCCPTTADCKNKLWTLPACADQTMDMYIWPYSPLFFCCTPGLVGVKPYSGDGGLCMSPDQDVPASLILTTFSQVGVGIVRTTAPVSASASGAPGSSGANAGIITSATARASGTAQATSLPTAISGSTSNDGENSGPVLTTGAIIGIAVGGAVVLLIAMLLWRSCSKRKVRREANGYRPPTMPPMYPAVSPQPMYVSTGQPYYTPGGAPLRGDPNKGIPPVAVVPVEQPQSPAPPVSELSSPGITTPPPPQYGATPAHQYRELHGENFGVPRRPVENMAGRQEM